MNCIDNNYFEDFIFIEVLTKETMESRNCYYYVENYFPSGLKAKIESVMITLYNKGKK